MIYRCPKCGYEECVDGSALDGPIIVHSKVLGVTVKYASSLVKNMADAETRHIMKVHFKEERKP